MKKVFLLASIFAALFFFTGCGEGDPEIVSPDEDEVSDTGEENTDTEDPGIVNDEDAAPETDEELAADEDSEIVEEPDDTEEPDESPVPAVDPIGSFDLSFSGQVNTSISMQSRGGTGVVNFIYNDQPFTFQEIKVAIDIFPLAMVNSGNVIVMWLDSFSLGDLSGTSEKQVFGISFPQNAEIGSGTMKELGSYAFYGDITVNIQGGAFNVKCVRAVSDSGEYSMTSNDGTNISFTAAGDLFDPSLAGSYIPYPACE